MTTKFKDKLEVKNNTTKLFILIIFLISFLVYMSIGHYEEIRVIFERSFSYACALTFLFVFSLVFLIAKIINNKPQIIISETGIWTKKNELIDWDKILSIETQKDYDENLSSTKIILKIKDLDKPLKIEATFLKPDINTIIAFMRKVNTNHKIIFL